ncbi:hypothetical protein ACU4GD_08105 [Cupriavidus basilensis]
MTLAGEERLATGLGYRTRDSDRITEAPIPASVPVYRRRSHRTAWLLRTCNVRVDAKGFVLTGSDTPCMRARRARLRAGDQRTRCLCDWRRALGLHRRVLRRPLAKAPPRVAQIHGYLAKLKQPEPGMLAM